MADVPANYEVLSGRTSPRPEGKKPTVKAVPATHHAKGQLQAEAMPGVMPKLSEALWCQDEVLLGLFPFCCKRWKSTPLGGCSKAVASKKEPSRRCHPTSTQRSTAIASRMGPKPASVAEAMLSGQVLLSMPGRPIRGGRCRRRFHKRTEGKEFWPKENTYPGPALIS